MYTVAITCRVGLTTVAVSRGGAMKTRGRSFQTVRALDGGESEELRTQPSTRHKGCPAYLSRACTFVPQMGSPTFTVNNFTVGS